MKKIILLAGIIAIALSACSKKEEADYIFFNAKVYQVNEAFDTAQAFAVKDGKFIGVGSDDDVLNHYSSDSVVDMQNMPVYPGFIDGHAHFYRYSLGLRNVNLVGTASFDEIVTKLTDYNSENPDAEWILGRGWDQNDWENTDFPTKDTLDILFPNKVVMLTRIDGHAVLTNQKGLDLAQIDASTKISGGEIQLKDGQPTGVLVDNAIDLLSKNIPALSPDRQKELLAQGEENCFGVGLTSVADAGLDRSHIELIDEIQQDSALKMRVYAMVNPTSENIEHYFGSGHYKTDRLHVRSFKVYADGALGSRGACLIEPYHDAPETTGFLLNSLQQFDSLAKLFMAKNFQMNTHCIGDSANRAITDIYGKYLKGKNDRRWRIEHAQVVHLEDLSDFERYDILPSVQPTHATSDMYWADERLGEKRVKTAYAYKDLLKRNGKLVLGSDFPVEDINPIYGFHAAVARQDANDFPADGFQIENALTREEALKGMTIWAAFGQFEEQEKGSIEKGKLADFVILDQDIMKAEASTLRGTKVLQTWSGGEKVFELR